MALNWHSLEVWSDLIGLASATAMVAPAWQADSLAAFVTHLRAVLKSNAGVNVDPNAETLMNDLERDAEAWKPSDRHLLRLGVLLLGASFLLKMAHPAGWQF